MSWAVLGLEWEPEEAWGRPWEENIGKRKENHRFWEAQGAFYDLGPAECARPAYPSDSGRMAVVQKVWLFVSHGVRPQGASRILSASRTPAGQRNA